MRSLRRFSPNVHSLIAAALAIAITMLLVACAGCDAQRLDAAPRLVTATMPTIAATSTSEGPGHTVATRASRSRPVAIRATGPTGDCMSGWGGLAIAERTAKAHRCWDGLLSRYSWDFAGAFRRMMCESGGDPLDVGPSTRWGRAQGLMQILPGGSFDPETNVAQAWAKYRARGWEPWTCR